MAILYFEACATQPYLDAAKRAMFVSRLPFARQARINSPKAEALRASRAAAERALTLVLRRAGEDYSTLTLAYTDMGKPYFEGRPDLAVSFSHSGGAACVLLAKSEDGATLDVGVDLERVAPREGCAALAERFFSPARMAEFEAAPDKEDAFLRLWVQTEAAVKMTGKGMQDARTAEAPYVWAKRVTLFGEEFWLALAMSRPPREAPPLAI